MPDNDNDWEEAQVKIKKSDLESALAGRGSVSLPDTWDDETETEVALDAAAIRRAIAERDRCRTVAPPPAALLEFEPEQPPEEPEKPGLLSRVIDGRTKEEQEADKDEDLEDVVGLSEGDRDYLFGGTDDDMVSYPKDDIIAIPEKDREFLFGGIKDESVSRPSESTIKDLVEVDKGTQEYLTGTGGLGGLGGSPEPNSHTRNISENRPARRSTYSVSSKKSKRPKSAYNASGRGSLSYMRNKR